MFEWLLARDRLLTTGLVLTGLMMVGAGVFSGRSTFDYVLAVDARMAAQRWVGEVESRAGDGTRPAQIGKGLKNEGPASEIFNELDRLLGGGADATTGLDDHVSRVSGVAVLDGEQNLLGQNNAVAESTFDAQRQSPKFKLAFAEVMQTGRPQVVRSPATGDNEQSYKRLVLVPVIQGDHVKRVYVVEANQRSAELMTEVALTTVSVVTGLLIVMGFVVPAAIATRRIRERWTAEDKIRFLALHDPLTGLPNRVQLRERLDQATARAKRHGRIMAVLCLDLDRFKDINDTLGHATGDALLQEVSERLRRCVREVDIIGRLGGDEFAIVAEDIDSPEDATRLARRLCNAVAEPFDVNGHEFANSVSIGIALGPVESVDGDVLLKNADLALYRAKHDGRNTFRFFEPEMDAALQERRRLEHELRSALRNNEMEVRYQPQYQLDTGNLTGYEALLRWNHPTRGEVQPSVFVPIAEDTGLISSIGEWVLRTACAYATTWPDHISLAVNLSPAQFKAQDVVGNITRILSETGFPPERLEIEITEGLLLQNTEAVIATLKRLDAMGIAIAMDDFGTGYSSLSYLTRFPVRKIKIDRSFIDTLGTKSETTAIVSSIVGLGQSLNVTITAEGVENADQADLLRSWGCDQVQGFFYGHPNCEVGDSDAEVETEKAQARAVA